MEKEIIVLCVIVLGTCSTEDFKLIPNNGQYNVVTVNVGASFTMVCKAYSDYEYCTFQHTGNKCLFEWKRKVITSSKVELQEDKCTKYRKRIKFMGDYSKDTCAIQLNNVTLDDDGEWTCELEEYKFYGRGKTDKQTVSLKVNIPSYYDSKTIYSNSGDKELAVTITTPEHIFGRSSVTSLAMENSKHSTLTITSNPKEKNVERDKIHTRIIQSIDNGTKPHENSNSTNSSNFDGEERKGKLVSSDESIPRSGIINTSENEPSSSPTSIVVALLSMLVVSVLAVMLILHLTRKLPSNFYTLGGLFKDKKENQSFDLYLGKDAVSDIDRRQSLKKHPSIVKKGRGNTAFDRSSKRTSQNTSISEVSHISGGAYVENDEKETMIPKGTLTSIGNATIIAEHRNNDINTTRCNFQSPNEFLRQSVELPLDDTQT